MHAWEVYGFDSENEYHENKLVIFKDDVDSSANSKMSVTGNCISQGQQRRRLTFADIYAWGDSEVDLQEEQKIEDVDIVVRKKLHRKCQK